MHPGLQGQVMWLPRDVSPWGEFLEEVRAGYSQRSGCGEASRDQIKVNLSWELLKGTDIVRVSTLTAHSISLVGNGSQED